MLMFAKTIRNKFTNTKHYIIITRYAILCSLNGNIVTNNNNIILKT